MKKAVFPFHSDSIFGSEGKYDLYGPIWIIITLNICIAIFGNLAGIINSIGTDDDYEFEVIRITSSAGFLTTYFLVIPLGFWLAMKFLGDGELPDYFYLVSVYGYCFAPFIPAIALYIIPSNLLKWALLIGASGTSLYFITKEMFGLIA